MMLFVSLIAVIAIGGPYNILLVQWVFWSIVSAIATFSISILITDFFDGRPG